MKKSLIIVIFCLLLGSFLGLNFVKNSHLNPKLETNPSPLVLGAIATPPPSKVELPIKLIIPKIGVDAKIEQVGLDSQNRMDVPKVADDAGWYNLGPKPGEEGNAVIDGHLDRVNGATAVFWNLKNLQIGDQIQIQDAQGKNLNFKIIDKQSYPWESFPITKVFGPTNKKMLNLITCQGSYDIKNQIYTQREVIFSEIMP